MRRSKCPCCDGQGTIPPLVNSKQVREMLGINKFSELMNKLAQKGFPKNVKPNWPTGYQWYRKDINKYIKETM